MKKLPLTLGLLCAFAFGFVGVVHASEPFVYPIYGYHADKNLCEIKQTSAEAEVRKNLQGDYLSLRECRMKNPEVFLNTGLGIAIWLIVFLEAFLFHFFISKLFKKRLLIEKQVSFLMELAGICLFMFFAVLLQHYFSVPSFYYDYGSDLDFILYSTFIHPCWPIFYLCLYSVLLSLRIGNLYIRRK